MPIVNQVHAVLFDGKSPAEAVQELMTRSHKSEFYG
jgi:glycerol-3-phosphate dehydrogenase (NAD(P)+)